MMRSRRKSRRRRHTMEEEEEEETMNRRKGRAEDEGCRLRSSGCRGRRCVLAVVVVMVVVG
eukprot:5148523-Pyramimonas_sp.AAC.1